MNSEQNRAVRMIIAELPATDQHKIKGIYDRIMNIIVLNGDAGTLAIALIGSELMGDD
jgi:hypothetical protein